MNDKKLLASSGTLEGVHNLVKAFYCGSLITLTPFGDNRFSVANSQGIIPNVHIEKARGRYKFIWESSK